MGKSSRRSIAAETDGSLNPTLDLKDTVRQRKLKMLKTTISSIGKLDENSTDANILVLKHEAESKWNDFMRAFEEQEAILIAVDDNALTEITNEFVNMHNSYVKAKIHASNLLSKSAQNESEDLDNSTAANENRPTFKMAPLKITPFGGDLADWIEFKATCDLFLDSNIPEA